MIGVDAHPVTPGAGIARDVATIGAASFVTLHYRVAAIVDGAEREMFTTFAARPATWQLGAGQLAPALETCLLGLAEGASATFELAAGDGFGHRHPELVQALAAALVDDGDDHRPGDVVEIQSDGRRVAGVVKGRDAGRLLLDFNHPLAGLPLRFTVRVIGVL
jgi:FKBP-type peptidyl-prolyl cis-trans isomerase SlpA